MEQRKWLYYLIDAQGRSFRKEAGIVLAKTDKRPLRYTSDGWQEITIAWERNLSKHGVIRNFSLPLGFYLDGADILRSMFWNGNLEQVVYLLIQKQFLFLDATKYYYYYDLFHKGELDMSTIVDGELKVSVNLMEGGLSKDLKANEGMKYEIPCDEINVRLETAKLFESGTVEIVEGIEISKSVMETFAVPIIVLGDESSVKPGMSFFAQRLESTGNTVTYVNSSVNYFGKAADTNPTAVDFRITGTIRLKITTNDLPFGLRFRFMTSSMTIANQNIYMLPSFPNTIGEHEMNVDSTVSLAPGEKLFLIGIIFGGATGAIELTFEFLPNSSLTVAYQYRHPATFVKAVHPLTLWKRLIGKVTGDEDNGASTLLETFKHLVLISGDAIRGLPGAVIKTSVNDFSTSFNAVLNTGEGIESGKIIIESKDYFYQNTNVIPLGRSRRCEHKVAKELLANSFKIGYPDQEYDDVNGKQEFNVQHIYSSPLKRIVAELDLTSVYRADAMGITFTQINLAGKNTTDSSSDNDIFILNIDFANPQTDPDLGTYYNLKRLTYDEITGILDSLTIFNIEDLTPARMAERHRSWINGMMYGFEGQKLTFQTTDKNRTLRTRLGTVIFDEDADILISDTPRLFKPRTFEFEPESPEALAELLDVNPNRCFSFIHDRNGRTYTGFTMKIGIAPNTLSEQAFLLLSTAENDLKTLVT